MTRLSTHVLDVSQGRPAAGVSVVLEMDVSGSWKTLAHASTNSDGRLANLLDETKLTCGSYRLLFDVGSYFRQAKIKSFYTIVPVQFEVEDPAQQYHVPLLLSPFGYSTYRGS